METIALERLGLHRQLLRLRMVEDRIAVLLKRRELAGPVPLARGWEAVAVGACHHLRRGDATFANRRVIGPYLVCGGDLERLLAELFGRRTGCSGGRGGAVHLIDMEAGFLGASVFAAATMTIACGHALAARQRGEARVTVCFLDDVAVEAGGFHESLAFAVAHQLPVVFVCQTSAGQPSAWRMAGVHGVDSAAGDGSDVLAVESLTGEAVVRARAGHGPSFLEFSIPSAPGGRVADLEGWLLAGGQLRPAKAAAVRAEIAMEIERALAFARLSPAPSPAGFHQLHAMGTAGYSPVPGPVVELFG